MFECLGFGFLDRIYRIDTGFECLGVWVGRMPPVGRNVPVKIFHTLWFRHRKSGEEHRCAHVFGSSEMIIALPAEC